MFVQTIDDDDDAAETQTRRAKTPTAPTDRGTNNGRGGRACGRAGGREGVGPTTVVDPGLKPVGEMLKAASSYTIAALFLFDTTFIRTDDAVTYVQSRVNTTTIQNTPASAATARTIQAERRCDVHPR